MNVYQHIAENNPYAANEFCKKYGYYQNQYIEEIPDCLQIIVADNGESAFKDLMELHPEKSVILELFQPEPQPMQQTLQQPQVQQDCGCTKNADGTASNIASSTNVVIIVAALIISISLIAMKK
jgi:hypothetical protein